MSISCIIILYDKKNIKYLLTPKFLNTAIF